MNPHTENPDIFADQPVEALRQDALAMVEQCSGCGLCYLRCAFANYGDDPAVCRQWVRESNDYLLGRIDSLNPELTEATFRCAQCNRCRVQCPKGTYRRHGNLMIKHLVGNRLRHRLNIHPHSHWQFKQPALDLFSVSKWKTAERDWYRHRLNNIRPAEVLLYHGCYVYSQAAQCLKLEEMLTAAGVTFTTVGKLKYCCGSFAFYRGHNAMARIKPRLISLVENIAPQRILTNCGHCFNAMSDLAEHLPRGRRPAVRHAAEELLDLHLAGRLPLARLGEAYAIHDACNLRSLHADTSPLRALLRRLGEIRELLLHGAAGGCCGDVIRYSEYQRIAEKNLRNKVSEFQASGAGQLVTVCAGCHETLQAATSLPLTDLIDLVHQAFTRSRDRER